jgi:predicted RNase H-related nuclease YkuK (DUF458 family)
MKYYTETLRENQKKDLWSYPPFAEWVWKSYDNTMIVNIDDFIKNHRDAQFFIGTDSQTEKGRCILTTALIAYHWGKGGSVIIHTQKVPKFPSLRQKLIAEAMRSLETAWYADPKIPEESVIVIHVDVNANTKFMSGQYKDDLVGMIMAQGFEIVIKPDSWGSSKVADRRCKRVG